MTGKLNIRLKQKKFKSKAHEAYLNLLVASGQLQNDFEEICSRHGITSSQYNVLRILKGVHPAGYPRCEIIDRMIDRSPDVTRLLDRLIKMKLAERYISSEDKRFSLARITGKGIELLKIMDNDVEVLDNYLNKHLTEKECETLSNICEKLY